MEIAGIADDSRAVRPGFLFAAIRGTAADGGDYLDEALANGAACALCEEPPPVDIPYVLVPSARYALALVAAEWYGRPADRMTMIAVTGTNGKTTTTYLIKQMLETACGARVGLIGTNQNMIGERILPAERTTPGSLALQALLAQMADSGCTHVVMEASSHALAQDRTAGIRFAAGVFTNLTQDHLDYHGTMEAYCDAKARLFRQCGAAIVNGDDPWHERLLRGAQCSVRTFGQDMTNDLVGWRARYENDRVRFIACDDQEHVETFVPIPGAFSLYNALGALLTLQSLGVPLPEAAGALERCRGVRGRCEIVPAPLPCTVLIDYAHTPDGLKNILSAVCAFAENRVIVVFGCGGDRDRTKRARMGRIAAALADFVIVTSDNPRTESPYAILHNILDGMNMSTTPFAVLEDRREAVFYALDHAQRGDVVVLAGKGHETYQIVGTDRRALDEREVVREYLEQRKDAAVAAAGNAHEDHSILHTWLSRFGGDGAGADPEAARAEGGAGDPGGRTDLA